MFKSLLFEQKQKRPLILAHRGYSSIAPENTMAAFDLVCDKGLQAIELDVQLTYDSIPIIFHDKNLRRTTNGKGILSRKTWTQLCELDAGSYKNGSFSDQRIPLLTSVIETYKDKLLMNIELKKDSVLPASNIFEETVIKVIEHFNFEASVILSSFSRKAIRVCKNINPNILTGLLYTRSWYQSRNVVDLAKFYQADTFHCSKKQIGRKQLAELVKAHIPVLVYTINDVETAYHLWELGVSGFFTDYPEDLNHAFS